MMLRSRPPLSYRARRVIQGQGKKMGGLPPKAAQSAVWLLAVYPLSGQDARHTQAKRPASSAVAQSRNRRSTVLSTIIVPCARCRRRNPQSYAHRKVPEQLVTCRRAQGTIIVDRTVD